MTRARACRALQVCGCLCVDVVTLFPQKGNEAQAVSSSGADAAPADCTLRCLHARTLALRVEVGGRWRLTWKVAVLCVRVVHVRVFTLRFASLRLHCAVLRCARHAYTCRHSAQLRVCVRGCGDIFSAQGE